VASAPPGPDGGRCEHLPGRVRGATEPGESVLRGSDLTWTAFVSETQHVAEDAGISKGTRTDVSRPLASRGLLNRAGHPTDGQLALIRLTDEGQARRSRRRRPEA
jgi:hypothetical protein